MRTIALVALVLLSLGFTQPRGALDDLTGRSRALLTQRAKTCYRMPDGVVWDAWGDAEHVRAAGHCWKKVNYTRQIGLRVVGAGSDWKCVDRDMADAWGIRDPDENGPIVHIAIDYGVGGSRTYGGAANNGPAWWYSSTATKDTPRPIYFDKDGAIRTGTDYGDNLFELRGRHDSFVKIDKPARLRGDQIVGTYFLWPDQTIAPPAPDRAGDIAAGIATVYRVIDADDLRMSAADLRKAVEAKEIVLYEWTYKRPAPDARVTWTRREIAIETRPQPAPK